MRMKKGDCSVVLNNYIISLSAMFNLRDYNMTGFLRWGVCLGIFLEENTYAYVGTPSQSLGGVAHNLLDAERSLQSFIQFVCLMTGVGLLIASIGMFKKHWQNPAEVALSRPVAMVILGVALVVLAFIPMPVNGG